MNDEPPTSPTTPKLPLDRTQRNPGFVGGSEHDGTWNHAIDPSRSCSSIPPHPIPRHREERGIGDKVEQIIEPTISIVTRPLVQLGLDTQYPRPSLIETQPRLARIHALRDEPGSGSVSRDGVSLSRAAAGEQDAEPVVGQVAEPAA